MKDWIDTLTGRQAGYVDGFLAADIPLEDQDLEHGGPLAVPADDEEPPKTRTTARTDELPAGALADEVPTDKPADPLAATTTADSGETDKKSPGRSR